MGTGRYAPTHDVAPSAVSIAVAIDVNCQLPKVYGRMELAQAYFPYLQPRSAWHKFRALMQDYPELSGYATQKRRTFLPSEVNIIYQTLGHP